MSNWKALLTVDARQAIRRAERHGWECHDITDDGCVEMLMVQHWQGDRRIYKRRRIYVYAVGSVART
jgi:hypothetical protein